MFGLETSYNVPTGSNIGVPSYIMCGLLLIWAKNVSNKARVSCYSVDKTLKQVLGLELTTTAMIPESVILTTTF